MLHILFSNLYTTYINNIINFLDKCILHKMKYNIYCIYIPSGSNSRISSAQFKIMYLFEIFIKKRGVAYDWHTVERMVGYLEFLLLLTVQ